MTAAHFTVHISRSSIEFWSAIFYNTCSDLCSKMEGEFWFLCNFQSPAILVAIFLLLFAQARNVRSLLYRCVYATVHVTFFVTIEIAKETKTHLLPIWNMNTDQNMRCKILLTKILNWTAGGER